MNKMDQDNFIFNYLEGNLTDSEKSLCEELIQTDADFKSQVKLWESSYYNKDQEPLTLTSKAQLAPKSMFKYWVLTVAAIFSTVLVYQYISLDERTKKLEDKIDEIEASKVVSTPLNASVESVVKTEDDKLPIVKKPEQIKQRENIDASVESFIEQKLEDDNLVGIDTIVITDSVTKNTGEITIALEEDTVTTIKTDTITNDYKKEEEIIVAKTIKPVEEKKKVKRWKNFKSLMKNQRVIIME